MGDYFKYPRTPHLPWSPGATSDDVFLVDTSLFDNKQVVVTEKMDGENTTLYADYMHARSVNSRYHPSRDWVKGFHGTIAHLIPKDWRVCGENLYAIHSIEYDNLPSYFLAFGIFDEKNICLSWEDFIEKCEELKLATPKVFYKGIWDQAKIKAISFDRDSVEGYVVRIADSFHFHDFAKSVAKCVREGHVQTQTHWMHQQVRPNKLKGGQ